MGIVLICHSYSHSENEPKDEKTPVGGGAGGRCCAICRVVGLVPHKVIFDHIAIGMTRAHNALREQRLVRRVGVHLGLEGKAGAPAIVGIVLGVLVAQPVAGVELHARGSGVVVHLTTGPHLLDVHRAAQVAAVLIAIDAQAVIVATGLLDLRVVGLHAGCDGAKLAKVKRCSLDRSDLAGGDVLLVNGQVVGGVGDKEMFAVHAGVMACKVKVRVVGHGHVGGAVALAAIIDAEDAGARHGKHGRKGAVAGQAQLAILKRGGHAHGIVDLVELNIPYALVQAVLKIAVQVVDALVGRHMPVRAVDGDRGARGAVCHGADGRAKAGGVVKVILELIEAQYHIAHVAGNVGHIDTQHGGAIVHNANADLGPVEGVTMNGGTARRGAEKLGSDHLVPNIEVFPTNCSANRRDYHYTPLKQGVFFSKK